MNTQTVYKRFPDRKDCIAHLEAVRWDGKPRCPYCNSSSVKRFPNETRYHCKACNTSFSVTVRTIFHRSKIDLQIWFFTISLILNTRKGLSARELARQIGVNKNTAWLMLERIRNAGRGQRVFIEELLEADIKSDNY